MSVCMVGYADGVSYGCDYENFRCAVFSSASVLAARGFEVKENVSIENQVRDLLPLRNILIGR